MPTPEQGESKIITSNLSISGILTIDGRDILADLYYTPLKNMFSGTLVVLENNLMNLEIKGKK